MRVRRKPIRPDHRAAPGGARKPLYADHSTRIVSWSKFIGEAYWNVELQK